MKTSRLVLAPAVAVALTGLAGAPAFAATESASVPAGPLCAYDDAQQSTDPETDTKVPDKSDPQATLAHAQVTQADIANRKKGIGFSGTGFTPDNKATVTVVGTDGTKYSPKTKLTVDEKGKVSGTYFFSVTEEAKVPTGDYSLYLTDAKSEKDSSKVSFEVVSKASDVDDSGNGKDDCAAAKPPADPEPTDTKTPSEEPTESTAPSTTAAPTPSETKTEEPSQKPTESKRPRQPLAPPKPAETDTKTPEPTETASEAPKPTETGTPKPTETNTKTPAPAETDGKESKNKADESAEAPKPTESEDSKSESTETTAPASPGTEDKEKKGATAATQALIIDPTEISSEDFLNKGIKLGITGAQPGEKITITVEQAQGKVDRYTMTKTADSEGKATFGVQAKVKAVLGTYNVRAQAESFDKPQGGSFTVVTNGTSVDDGSGNDSNSSGSGSDLPRTGAEMTGLALGVGLLVVGAAAVVITRRRMTASDDPAEF